ncbi:uncharacterized protein PFL1_06196 [Pseudozyma flocculosa PF-1]|uniref:BRO domain-containing protein 1 n=2 Tax=Pseudozyma flocculosa TaxID=84751 RepID=A0A5C3F764_9BASI|nr:uncharacterized protein PFL1_06196 [Pseudozyma flocculosa PF-1]EPQ26261.1 hypothetical protein PFL1_06196 [Pseudozyma flocculosa PF-1]SPO40222.1 related to Vacuolar protein-sorting protein BRO1 [Pseudozyma flocculosa]
MSDSSQAPLVSLPLKTTEEVDLGSAVRTIITNTYGEEPSAYAEQTAQLNRARQDAVRGAGSDSTARDLLYKWFHMLEMLEARFPELRVPFPWNDAFTHKTISQSSLAYEKASIIFNIAATLSSLASSQPRLAGNPEGLKRAYSALRQAAGMLTYINENFLHAPSTDMSKDVVKALVGLMLAQASEVFLEKSIEEKKSHGLVAKLASHTASAYNQLVEDAKEFVTKGYFERSWSHLIQVKAKYFSSMTQYYRALADDASGNHGASLVRLTVAETQAKEAQKLSNAFNVTAPGSISASRPSLPSDAVSAMSALLTTHLAVCTERKAQAVKNNDLIYHDILPSESTLPAVDKLVAATPISIQEIFKAPEVQRILEPDLFQRLIPLAVHESASMYSEEKAKIARAESERHDLANGELQAALEYMGLPASLKQYRGIGKGAGAGAADASLDALADPGAEVMRWSEEEAQGGGGHGADGLGTGTDGVASGLDRIARLRGQASSSIETATAALDDENRECEKLRVKYGHRWTQDPAGLHTKDMRAGLKENREALQQATANDRRIQELWESIRDDVSLLVAGRDTLESAFAAALSGSSGSSQHRGSAPGGAASLLDLGEEEDRADEAEVRQVQTKLAQIDEGLLKLHKMKKDRGEVLADLKEKIQTDDISHVLVLNRRAQNVEPAIFAQELEKFKAHQNRLAVSAHHQQVVLGEVTQAYKDLESLPAARRARKVWEEKQRARDGLVGRLRRAKEGHAEVRAAVARGVQFYTDLLEIVDGLRRNVETYVKGRKAEREKLSGELEWDDKLSGYQDTGRGVASPPPPPPLPGQARPGIASPTSPLGGGYASGLDALQGSFGGMTLNQPQHPQQQQQPPSRSTSASYPGPGPAPPPLPPMQGQGQPQRQGSYNAPSSSLSYDRYTSPPPLQPPPQQQQQGYTNQPLPPPSMHASSPTKPYSQSAGGGGGGAYPPPPLPSSTTTTTIGGVPPPPARYTSSFSPPPLSGSGQYNLPRPPPPPSQGQGRGYGYPSYTSVPPPATGGGHSYVAPSFHPPSQANPQPSYYHHQPPPSQQPQQQQQQGGYSAYSGYAAPPPPPPQQQQQQQQLHYSQPQQQQHQQGYAGGPPVSPLQHGQNQAYGAQPQGPQGGAHGQAQGYPAYRPAY